MPGIRQETFVTSDMASCDPGKSSGRRDTFMISRGRGCGQQKFWTHQYFPSNSSNRNWRGGSNSSSYNDWRSTGVSGARCEFTQFHKTGGECPVSPPGLDGKRLLCKGCGSYRHFISACPDSREQLKRPRNVHVVNAGCDTYESYADTHNPHTASQYFYRQMNTCDNYDYEYSGEKPYFPVNKTLVAGINQESVDMSVFNVGTSRSAILDTACVRTVCGQQWFDGYKEHLKEPVDQVLPSGNCSFKFGAGPVIQSLGAYDLLVAIEGEKMLRRTVVVDTDIPLLLSKEAMKEAGIVIDLINDSAIIFGQEVPLDTTSAGHYCLPISMDLPVQQVSETLSACIFPSEYSVEGMTSQIQTPPETTSDDLYTTLLKLHRQCGHPSKNRLKLLLKDADLWLGEYKTYLETEYSKCRESGLCKFKDKVIRPVVALPLARDFNDRVALDLKYWKGQWILHMVDMWSRYTVSVFVPRKRPSDIIYAIMTDWNREGSLDRQRGRIHKWRTTRSGSYVEHWASIYCHGVPFPKRIVREQPSSRRPHFVEVSIRLSSNSNSSTAEVGIYIQKHIPDGRGFQLTSTGFWKEPQFTKSLRVNSGNTGRKYLITPFSWTFIWFACC